MAIIVQKKGDLTMPFFPILRREGYLALVLRRAELQVAQLGTRDDPIAIAAEEVADRFPLTTAQVATFLISWGIVVSENLLRNFVNQGEVPEPKATAERTHRRWGLEDVDAAAAVLLERGNLTPSGFRRLVEGSDAQQDMIAELEARTEHGDVDLVRVVLPGLPGADKPAVVLYRPITEEEDLLRRRVWNARR